MEHENDSYMMFLSNNTVSVYIGIDTVRMYIGINRISYCKQEIFSSGFMKETRIHPIQLDWRKKLRNFSCDVLCKKKCIPTTHRLKEEAMAIKKNAMHTHTHTHIHICIQSIETRGRT